MIPDPNVGRRAVSPADGGSSPGRRKTLVIADDHPLMAQGIRAVLEPTYDVAGVAGCGRQLLELLRDKTPDAILMDLALPDTHGLELLSKVRGLAPGVPVLVLTVYDDRAIADACFSEGACGFLPKLAGRNELLEAVATVLSGLHYLSFRVPKTSHGVGFDAPHVTLARLTLRQREIMRLIGSGMGAAEVAQRLGLGRSTVSIHTKHIMRALGFSTRRDLWRFAILMNVAGAAAGAVSSATHWGSLDGE